LPERHSRKTNRHDCPRISGIPVPEFLKSLSANYRNHCPGNTQLEEENAQLKRIVADLSLDKAMVQDVLSKKL